jgi:hypothetical protein
MCRGRALSVLDLLRMHRLVAHRFTDSLSAQGNETTFDGTVEVPEVGEPVLLITWLY